MKKIVFALLAALLLITGCGKTEKREEPQLTVNSIEFDGYYKGIAYEYGTFYLLNDEKVVKYTVADGEYVLLTTETAEKIDVYNDEVFLFDSEGVTILDPDGKQIDNISFNLEESGISSIDYCAGNDRYIVISGWKNDSVYLEHRVILINRKTQAVTDLTEILKGSYQVMSLYDLDLSDDDQLLITAKVSSAITNRDVTCTVYDIVSDTTTLRKNVPFASKAQFNEGTIYCYADNLLKKYNPDDDTTTTLRNYSPEKISNKLGSEWSNMQVQMILAGNNILMISPHTHSVYVDALQYAVKPLRILCPDSVDLYLHLQEIIADFESEQGINVEIVQLPTENYEDKLFLRFLSFDKEFDLYYLPKISSAMSLYTILQNDQYYPLNEFPEIQAVLDNFPERLTDVIKDDDKVFGLPWNMFTYYLEVNEELFEKYALDIPESDWTFEDVWELCEIIRERDLPVTVFSTDMEIFAYMLKVWAQECNEDASSLQTLLEQIISSQPYLAPKNAGAYGDKENSLFFMSWQYHSGNYSKCDGKLIVFPRLTDTSPYQTILFEAVLVNPNTTQSENAAKLLSAICSDKCTSVAEGVHDFFGPCKPRLLNGDVDSAIGGPLTNIYDQPIPELSEELYAKIRQVLFE